MPLPPSAIETKWGGGSERGAQPNRVPRGRGLVVEIGDGGGGAVKLAARDAKSLVERVGLIPQDAERSGIGWELLVRRAVYASDSR